MRRLVESLTPKEQQILPWIARGKSTAEIARALNVCSRTVKNRGSRLRQKLGTIAPAELVRLAQLENDRD